MSPASQQLKLRQIPQFRTKMHQNTFGGRAPPERMGEKRSPILLAAANGEGIGWRGRKGKVTGREEKGKGGKIRETEV